MSVLPSPAAVLSCSHGCWLKRTDTTAAPVTWWLRLSYCFGVHLCASSYLWGVMLSHVCRPRNYHFREFIFWVLNDFLINFSALLTHETFWPLSIIIIDIFFQSVTHSLILGCYGWNYVPQKDLFKFQPSLPMNMILFGNRIFADVVKLRWVILD